MSWLDTYGSGGELGLYERTESTDYAAGTPQAAAAPTLIEVEAPAPQSLPTPTGRTWLPRGPATAGIGLVALVAGLLYWVWPAMKQALFVPAYTRLARPAALAHPARAELLALIEQNP